MKKILFAAIFLLSTLLDAAAQQEYYTVPVPQNIFVDGGIRYRQLTDSTAEVYRNAFGSMPVQDPLVIPVTVQDSTGNVYTVTRIGDYAFENNLIGDITLPESLLEIGEGAFEQNFNLHAINFPSGLRRIEEYAFGSCRLVGKVTLPDSLEYIYPSVFYYNRVRNAAGLLQNSITEYTIANNPRFRTIDGILYTIDSTELVMAPNALSDTFYVPTFVRRLGVNSLCDCAVTHIILNNGLHEIGFLSLPQNVNSIEIPASVTRIDGNMYGSAGLTITVDSASRHYKTVDQMLLSYDGDTLVMGFGDWLGSKDLPEGIRVIGRAAFYHMGRTSTDSIGLPNSLVEICDDAFRQSNLKLAFPPNLRKVGTSILYYAYNVNQLTLPNSLTDIADYAFANSFIETIRFGDSLRAIPRGAMYNSPVSKVYIGSSVEHIMPEAFDAVGWGRISTLRINDDNYLPASLRTIGRDAFRGCNIARVKFHRNPDTVGEYAFNRTQRVWFADTVPPVVFDSSFMAGCDVYLPCRGTAAFTAAPGWGPAFNYMESPCPPTAVDDATPNTPFTVTAAGNLLTVVRTEAVEVGIYDLLGRCLLQAPASTATLHFRAPASGLYIVKAAGATRKALLMNHIFNP